jgi:hypothetical protein
MVRIAGLGAHQGWLSKEGRAALHERRQIAGKLSIIEAANSTLSSPL